MKIPVHNPSNRPMYVGASMVPAGETRHFEEHDVPHHLRPQPIEAPVVAQVAPDAMGELSKEPAEKIIELVAALSSAELERLGDIEQAKGDQARRPVLNAIAEQVLKLAGETGEKRVYTEGEKADFTEAVLISAAAKVADGYCTAEYAVSGIVSTSPFPVEAQVIAERLAQKVESIKQTGGQSDADKALRTSVVVKEAAAAVVAGKVTLEDAIKEIIATAPFEIDGDDIAARIKAEVADLKKAAKAASKSK